MDKVQGQEAIRLYDAMNGNGGGLHLERSHVHLNTCTITQNAAPKQGGGIWADVSKSTMVVKATLLSANRAASGAGVYITRTHITRVRNVAKRIVGMSAADSAAALDQITRIIETCILDNKVRRLVDSG